MAEVTGADRVIAEEAVLRGLGDTVDDRTGNGAWIEGLVRTVAAALATVRAEVTLTDEQIDERIRRYHDIACGYQLKNDALQARATALEAALLAIVYASDQCRGHRDCGHSMEPWQNARRLVAPAPDADGP